jgi:hypothetical protein
MLTTTPQGQAADAQFVKWLMEHQREAGVFATVTGLVDQVTDNPAAKMTAQEIAQRVRLRADGQRKPEGTGPKPNHPVDAGEILPLAPRPRPAR